MISAFAVRAMLRINYPETSHQVKVCLGHRTRTWELKLDGMALIKSYAEILSVNFHTQPTIGVDKPRHVLWIRHKWERRNLQIIVPSGA